jgi:hypothetical protein
MIFKIAVLFIGLGSLMTFTYDLTVLTKRKGCQIYMAYVQSVAKRAQQTYSSGFT